MPLTPPDAVLVDMDGTIIDTEPVAASIFERLARRFLDRELEPEEVRRFIGPPLRETMERLAGGNEALADAMTRFYRDLYADEQYEITLFDGVREMLEALRGARIRLALATSKPLDRAHELLEHLGITRDFDVTCGAPPDDGPGSDKASVVGQALRELGLADRPERVLMLGDRIYDVEGARAHGVATVLAGWSGLAGTDEQAAAWAVAATPRDAVRIMRGEQR